MKTLPVSRVVMKALLDLAPHFHVADGSSEAHDNQIEIPREELLFLMAEVADGEAEPLVAALRARPEFLAWLTSADRVTRRELRRWLKRTWLDDEVRVQGKNFAVELSWIGEGWEGDYCITDHEDTPLLRMDILRLDEEEMQDASFCTQIPATVGEKRAKELARELLKTLEDRLASDATDGGRIAQQLSWIDERGVAFCRMASGSVPC